MDTPDHGTCRACGAAWTDPTRTLADHGPDCPLAPPADPFEGLE